MRYKVLFKYLFKHFYRFQFDDKATYDCFLLATGQGIRIPKRNIRMLPSNLKELSSFTTKRLILQSRMDASGSTLSSIIPKETLVTTLEMKPSPGSKNPCKKGAGYQNQLQVTQILEASFDKPTAFPLTSSISKQSTPCLYQLMHLLDQIAPLRNSNRNSHRWSLSRIHLSLPKLSSPRSLLRELFTFRSKMAISLVTKNAEGSST